MNDHAENVRQLAAQITLSDAVREEIACLALHRQESPEEVLIEALSELRTLLRISCEDEFCAAGPARHKLCIDG